MGLIDHPINLLSKNPNTRIDMLVKITQYRREQELWSG